MTRWGAVLCAAMLAACQSQPPLPSNVQSGPRSALRYEAITLPPDAPPQIEGMAIPSGLDVRLDRATPTRFYGSVATSSNVASVELRTNLFSINAVKKGVGRFSFDAELYDLPSIFMRHYTLLVVARNTRGDETEEELPFRIR